MSPVKTPDSRRRRRAHTRCTLLSSVRLPWQSDCFYPFPCLLLPPLFEIEQITLLFYCIIFDTFCNHRLLLFLSNNEKRKRNIDSSTRTFLRVPFLLKLVRFTRIFASGFRYTPAMQKLRIIIDFCSSAEYNNENNTQNI